MAIKLYTGFVGSGKSFHAVKQGCAYADAPKGNGWVVANFPIKPKETLLHKLPLIGKRYPKYNEPRWLYKPNGELTVDFLVKLSMSKRWHKKKTPSCLLIFDEAGIAFNSRDWNVKPDERKGWIEFLVNSRKFGYDVIMIAQDQRMIDRQIRALAEFEVQHKKLNSWGFLKMFPITVFACISFWNGIRNMRGGLEMCTYSKKIANRYDTLALFGYAEEEDAPDGEGGPAQAGGSLPLGASYKKSTKELLLSTKEVNIST